MAAACGLQHLLYWSGSDLFRQTYYIFYEKLSTHIQLCELAREDSTSPYAENLGRDWGPRFSIAATMSISDLNKQSVSAWEKNAAHWDSTMGSTGNSYFRDLELPALERLVDPKVGEIALDLATGTGLVARWLAAKGCTVLATDASVPLLDIARKRAAEDDDLEGSISFRHLDVTDTDALNGLIKSDEAENGYYDIITMNMALMDVPTVTPLAQVLPRLLKRNGRFVATILHPVFSNPSASKVMTQHHDNEIRGYKTTWSMNISRYQHIPPELDYAVDGQPALQLHFHRPLHELLMSFFKVGLVLDGLEEPSYTESDLNEKRIQSRANFWQLPPILAFRLRRL